MCYFHQKNYFHTFSLFCRNIYLGETFSSYICVHNDSGQAAKDVTLKVNCYLTYFLTLLKF